MIQCRRPFRVSFLCFFTAVVPLIATASAVAQDPELPNSELDTPQVCDGTLSLCTLSAVRQLADHFYQMRLFFRAVGAYEQIAFFSQEPADVQYARMQIALAYHLGGQYDYAIHAYDQFLHIPNVDAQTREAARLDRTVALGERGVLFNNLEDLSEAVATLIVELDSSTSEHSFFAAFQTARFLLHAGLPDQARSFLTPLADLCLSVQSHYCGPLLDLDARLGLPEPETKSPALGAFLSAIVPGLGAMYAEHYVDGIYYFVITGSTALMAWDVYDPDTDFIDQHTTFYVLGTLGLLFYVANVVQAYNQTDRLNAIEWQRYYQHLDSGPLPSLLLDQAEHQPRRFQAP